MTTRSNAPIALFAYARPDHTRTTIEALVRNRRAKESELHIFSDGPRNPAAEPKVLAVRRYLSTVSSMKAFRSVRIVESETNKGLGRSVIEGVSELLAIHGKAIVVEDDLETSPDFLEFMNDGLAFFESDPRIWSLCGYSLPIRPPEGYNHDLYLGYRAGSWGWATWYDRWKTVDWSVSDYATFIRDTEGQKRLMRGGRDMVRMLAAQMEGRIDSWAIRWCLAQSRQNKLSIFPVVSRVRTWGADGSGTHTGKTKRFDVLLSSGHQPCRWETPEINETIVRRFRDHFGSARRFFLMDMKSILKRIIGWKGR